VSEIRLIRPQDLSEQTAQTPGMLRRTAIDGGTVGAKSLWVGVVTVEPGARTGAHHHGDCESVVCVTGGRIRMRFGGGLERSVEAGPGDFVFIPSQLVHQEVNASDTEAVDSIVIRDSQENTVIPVDVPDELLRNG